MGDKCVKGQPVVISDGVVCEMGITKMVIHIRDMYEGEELHDSTEEDEDSEEEFDADGDGMIDAPIVSKKRKFVRKNTVKMKAPTVILPEEVEKKKKKKRKNQLNASLEENEAEKQEDSLVGVDSSDELSKKETRSWSVKES